MKSNEDILSIVYRRNNRFIYEIEDDGRVRILEEQNHWIQRLFRKIGFKIPRYKKTELDKFASFVLRNIDGKKNIKEIGELLKKEFGEEAEPLYERLLVFLNYIDLDCNYIEKEK